MSNRHSNVELGNWGLTDTNDVGVWDGALGATNQQNAQRNSQQNIGLPNPFEGPTFINQQGRRCRVVCDPPRRRPQPRPQLIGRTVTEAQSIVYPRFVIREVIRNGQRLPTTMDFRTDRINVRTQNGRITGIEGYY